MAILSNPSNVLNNRTVRIGIMYKLKIDGKVVNDNATLEDAMSMRSGQVSLSNENSGVVYLRSTELGKEIYLPHGVKSYFLQSARDMFDICDRKLLYPSIHRIGHLREVLIEDGKNPKLTITDSLQNRKIIYLDSIMNISRYLECKSSYLSVLDYVEDIGLPIQSIKIEQSVGESSVTYSRLFGQEEWDLFIVIAIMGGKR